MGADMRGSALALICSAVCMARSFSYLVPVQCTAARPSSLADVAVSSAYRLCRTRQVALERKQLYGRDLSIIRLSTSAKLM